MFGMGFTEMLLIAIVAVLFLGPDKLPTAMVEVAKFFKKVKTTLTDAKESIDEELDIARLREEALEYKNNLNSASTHLNKVTTGEIIKDNIKESFEQTQSVPKQDPKPEVVTFTKKSKQADVKPITEDKEDKNV